MDPLLFLISGIVLYTLFSNIAIRSSNGVSANEALFSTDLSNQLIQ